MKGTATLVVSWLFVGGCFVGYDSRWGAETRAQQTVAEHATPDELRATPTEAASSKLRVMKVRAYASPRYAAEVTNEMDTVAKLVDRANEVLEPTLDVQLDLLDVKRWPTSSDDDLASLVEELAALDAGGDVDWVVGFVGSSPTLELSFKHLGEARTPGKHFVMRAMNDAMEYDSIRQSLSKIDEGERRKLYRKRIEHKETAIFLHELGHSLGVPHARSNKSLMHASYSHKADHYSDAAVRLMRLALEHRSTSNRTDLSEAAITHLRATAAVWVDAERDALLANARARTRPVEDPRPAAFASDERWRALRSDERSLFREAIELEAAGRVPEAMEKAAPLFDAHPEGYEIQELRCRLAMRVGGDAATMKAHCEPFNRLERERR